MAASPVNPTGGAGPTPGPPTPAPGGAAPGAAPGQGAAGPNPLQVIAAITRLAQILAQSAPAASQEAEAIIRDVQNAARKLIPQQGQAQQGTPSPSPF